MKNDLNKMVLFLAVIFISIAIMTGCALKYNPATGDVATEITLTVDEFMELYDSAKDWLNERGVEESKVFVVNGKRIRLVKENAAD